MPFFDALVRPSGPEVLFQDLRSVAMKFVDDDDDPLNSGVAKFGLIKLYIVKFRYL